ncbi:hypothetical protein MMC22_010370 [Lobaria immixta]|nr:hypothetical protein [Lobaria immixta]
MQSLSLPISKATAIATIILPILNGFGIQGGQIYAARSRRSGRNNTGFLSRPTIIAFTVLAIYETVIATLAFTHMVPPDDLTCLLDRKWSQLWSNKDEGAIKRIQDAHKCCGLKTIRDRAWPFPDKYRGTDECIKAFKRKKSCMGDWRQDEQIQAGLLLFVALMTFALKLLFLYLVTQKPNSWVHRMVANRFPAPTAGDYDESGTGNENGNGIPRRIEYRDNPVVDAEEEEDSASQSLGVSANRSGSTQSSSGNHGPAVQPSRLHDGNNEWAHE